MRPSFGFALLGLALSANPLPATERAASPGDDQPLACAGAFGAGSSEARQLAVFGARTVQTATMPGPAGMDYIGTTIFPDDPDRRMSFGWWDEDNRQYLSFVELAPSQTGPLGLRIGMSVAEVAAINGAPFEINGFGWDYGGYSNMSGEPIEGEEGDCFLALRFAPSVEDMGELDWAAVSGDILVSSDNPLLEALDVRVEVLMLSYAIPDHLSDIEYD